MARRSGTLGVVAAILLSCTSSCTRGDRGGHRGSEPGPLASAADGTVLLIEGSRCRRVDCDAGACDVACPPEAATLTVDVTERVRGTVTLHVDGALVLKRRIDVASPTGLNASVRARPARWPATVALEVAPLDGVATTRTATRVERERRFVRVVIDEGAFVLQAAEHRALYE